MRRAQNRVGEHYLSGSDNSFLDLFPAHSRTEKAFAVIEAAAIGDEKGLQLMRVGRSGRSCVDFFQAREHYRSDTPDTLKLQNPRSLKRQPLPMDHQAGVSLFSMVVLAPSS